MKCQIIKKLIPDFLEGELEALKAKEVREHLLLCADCQREVRLYEKSWDTLLNWREVEPVPGYISRFWTKLSLEAPWHERILTAVKEALARKRLAPVFVAVSIMIIVGSVYIPKYINQKKSETVLAKMAPAEIELLSNMELAQNLDAIEDIDNLDDLDIIEDIDSLES